MNERMHDNEQFNNPGGKSILEQVSNVWEDDFQIFGGDSNDFINAMSSGDIREKTIAPLTLENETYPSVIFYDPNKSNILGNQVEKPVAGVFVFQMDDFRMVPMREFTDNAIPVFRGLNRSNIQLGFTWLSNAEIGIMNAIAQNLRDPETVLSILITMNRLKIPQALDEKNLPAINKVVMALQAFNYDNINGVSSFEEGLNIFKEIANKK